MEKDKLIKIILKDLKELNEIAAELSASGNLTKLELDIAVSKSKLVYQEFEFLNDLNRRQENNVFPSTSTISAPIIPEEKVVEEVKHEATATENSEKEPEPDKIIEEPKNTVEEKAPQPEIKEEAEEVIEEKTKESITEQKEPPKSEGPETEEEEPDSPQQKTVGEHFVQGKSLNDLLIESKRLDHKLASTPIEKLEAAIGLNDRFQFTRELFDNNADLFKSTIQYIDQSENLNDAVAFLNSNFKWKKTETSIQFAQLVKRRFSE